jgi:CRP-like cAMP-binding protein
LGSWALFDDTPLAVGARSVADVRLLRISRTEFFDLLSDNMQITAAIFRTIVKRFRQLAGS